MKRKFFIGIIMVFAYGFFELSSWSVLFILKRNWELEYSPARVHTLSEIHQKALTHLLKQETKKWIGAYSPTLGWTNKKGGKTKLYRINSQGIRGDKEYSFFPPNQTIRISAFGDSFTFGSDVNNEDAWAHRLALMRSDFEVLNFGVGGYGLGQAFLRYKQDGIQFNSHINFIGFMTNNISRNVNIYRPFLQTQSQMPLSKPRFTMENNKLVLIKNPMQELSQYREFLDQPEIILPRLAAKDFYPYYFFDKEWPVDFLPSIRLFKVFVFKINQKLRPLTQVHYEGKTPALEITLKIFDEFVRESLRNDSLPIILIFPRITDVTRHLKGKSRQYDSLITSLESRGYLVVDVLDVFIEHSPIENLQELFITHYNPQVNEWVANHLFNYLKTNQFFTLSEIKNKVQQMKTAAALEN